MTSNEIRKKFLGFFSQKGHAVVRSDSLVPANDPTLLFTGAGMNQFKEQFMGKNITSKKAASCQKCLRTADIDNVGKTPRHHTFFEMLGNFSFGDYFKKEAILWAWEFMTEVMGLPRERLWVSVYEKDEESYAIWLKEVKVPTEKIVKLGADDNFWPANAPENGPNGPCGPCSEIFYDHGANAGCGKTSCNPACDCGRFLEVWNLVFTEFDRKSDGSLKGLPNKNIDTGMGLERITAVAQGAKTNFETDLFVPIVAAIKKELKDACREISRENVCLIADHIRAVVFAAADGVSPSNEKRGYVVRKLIRRAYVKSGANRPFLYKIVPSVAAVMKDAYPEVNEKNEHISAIVREEEKKFTETMNAAMPLLADMIATGKKNLKGEQVFKLVDTYGLPFEMIFEKACQNGISVDVEGFKRLMAGQKEQSRSRSGMACDFIFQPDHFNGAPRPESANMLPLKTSLAFIVKKGGEISDTLAEGEYAEVVTAPQSGCFYAESGGQVGEEGSITKNGAEMRILNTFAADGRTIFCVRVKKGHFKKGDSIVLNSDSGRKNSTAKNHTATHLLQSALRQVLGEHVKQSGSLVDAEHLRFDFTHMRKMSARELGKVEDMVNGWIQKAMPVSTETKSLNEAKAEGALSFFGEKYGDTVRVVAISGESKELCGGTHVENTSAIGMMKITAESSVASGIRRIEAVTGEGAKVWIKQKLKDLLGECGLKSDKASPAIDADIEKRVRNIIDGKVEVDGDVLKEYEEKLKPELLNARERAEKDIKKKRKEEEADAFGIIKKESDEIAAHPSDAGEIKFFSGILSGAGMALLKKAAVYLGKKTGSGVILLGSSDQSKACLVCAVTSDIAKKGVDAREIIKSVSGEIAGTGGGRETFAQAGGANPGGLEAAIKAAKHFITTCSGAE